jgi:hypothetical protein
MTTPGKLEVTLKINQLPTEAITTKNGWKEFKVDCGGRSVTVALRPRMWNKLTEAAESWPLWLATISGQMGPSIGHGFVLAEPSVQVFERKDKDGPPPAGEAVVAEVAPAPAPLAPSPRAVVPVVAERRVRARPRTVEVVVRRRPG